MKAAGQVIGRQRRGVPSPEHMRLARRDRGGPAGRLGRATALLVALLIAAFALAGALTPMRALAGSPVRVREVAENEFELPGYGESIDFSGIEVEGGFRRVDRLGPYYLGGGTDHDPSDPNDLYAQVKDSPGWMAPIDAATEKGSFSLRYTGGRYGKDEIDAIVTLADWTYVEPSGGWEAFPQVSSFERFQPGVFVAEEYRSAADDDTGYQNFNFYTVGLTDLTVEVRFVYAGTSTPVQAKGHLTCIDLDVLQTFSFEGAIVEGRITAGNPVLSLSPDQTTVLSTEDALSLDFVNSPDEYRYGLVGTYYDTTGERAGEPLVFHFGTSWKYGNTSQSFFALTSELLTLPDPSETPETNPTPPVKSVDRTEGVSVGDRVTYTVEATAHEQGVNCRNGYRYTSLEIIDDLPGEMRYVDGSGRLLDEAGADITSRAGAVTYEGSDADPADNTVRFEFSPEFLPTMRMEGERYRFVFEAELTEYPSDGSLVVRNGSRLRINGTGDLPSNLVETALVTPVLEVDKTADAYEFEVGDVIGYSVTYRQTAKNAQARGTVLSDNLPEGLELVAESVAATGIKDLPAPDVSGNRWSFDLDKLGYGDTVTVTYQARATSSANGTEVVNNASAHASNAMDADDPAEVYVNTAALEVTKDVDRYEGHVGASDQDPGFFEYVVEVTNAREGTVANDVVVVDDSLPEGMRVGRNSDGSMMVEVSASDGSDGSATWTGDRAEGSLADVAYRVGEEDDEHGQTRDTGSGWRLEPAGTGWRLDVDHLAHGVALTITYRAHPEESVSGWEIENAVRAEADNSLPADDRATVWVNQPHLVVSKEANLDSFTVGDHIVYHVTVTNDAPGTVGRNLVVSDLAHTEGVEIMRGSIRVYDSRGEDVTDGCEITYRHGPQGGETFIVGTGRDILCASDERPAWADGATETLEGSSPLGSDGETSMTVEYEVAISDAELAGKTIDNTALAVTDEPNTATTDDEVVDVKGARLVIDKSSDKEAYEAGEVARYTLVVTQTREDVVAGNVVVTDNMDEPGIGRIVEGSVAAVGPDGQAIEAKPEYSCDDGGDIVGFELATGSSLADEEKVVVTYDVETLAAGCELVNRAQASADNAIGDVDDCRVGVLGPRAAVSFEKEASAEQARVGDVVTYELTAAVSDNPALDVVISDSSLPDTMPVDLRGIRLRVNERDVDDFRLDVSGNGFAAHVGNLEPGDVATVTYDAQVRDESLKGKSVVNTAYLDSATIDEPLRDSAAVTVLDDEPAVLLEKTASAGTVRAGGRVTYTIEASVAEGAESGARRVVVSDEGLPDGMPIDMTSIRAWLCDRPVDPVGANISGNSFSIDFGDLRPGEAVRVTYDAEARDEPLVGTSVTNVATLDCDLLDEPLEASATVEVVDETQTTIEKTTEGDSAEVGQSVTYEVLVHVGSALDDVTLLDSGLPDGMGVDEGSLSVTVNDEALDVAPVMDGTGFGLELGSLEAGDEVKVSYEAEVTDEGLAGDEATNTARLESVSLQGRLEDSATIEIFDRVDDGDDGPGGDSPDDAEPNDDEPDAEEPNDPDGPGTDEGDPGDSTRAGETFPNTGQGPTALVLLASGVVTALAAVALRRRRRRAPRR